MDLDAASNEFRSRTSTWGWTQYVLCCFSLINLTAFMKLPLFQFYGSGWSVVSMIFVTFWAIAPVLYLQMRMGSQHCRSAFGLFAKYIPGLSGIALTMVIRNLVTVLVHTVLLSHAYSYLIFTFYICDRQICIGSAFMWSSCGDAWCSPLCTQDEQRTRLGPSPEDEFYNNYVLDHVQQYSVLQGGFASWFNVNALHLTMLVAAWLSVAATTVCGPRVFGYILYALSPIAIILFITMLIYGRVAIADPATIDSLWTKFYRIFAAYIPIQLNSIDPYYYEPLQWGNLGTLVVMTWVSQLWSGQFTTIAKWVGYGTKTKYIVFIPALVIFFILFQFPLILLISYFSYAYDLGYIRFHLIKDYAIPFVLIPRAFSMVGTHKALVTCWFLMLAAFTIMHVTLLLLTSIENIVEWLSYLSRRAARQPEYTRRVVCAILLPVLALLSIILVTRTGIFWIAALDRYLDMLLFLTIALLFAAYIKVFFHSTKIVLERVILIVVFILSALSFIGSYLWWLIAGQTQYAQRVMNYNWPQYDQQDLPGWLVAIGWVVAALPIPLGLLLGLIAALRHSEGPFSQRMRYLFLGSLESEEARNRTEVPLTTAASMATVPPPRYPFEESNGARMPLLASGPSGATGQPILGQFYDGKIPHPPFA